MTKPTIPAHRRASTPPREGGSKTLAERLAEYRAAEGSAIPPVAEEAKEPLKPSGRGFRPLPEAPKE